MKAKKFIKCWIGGKLVDAEKIEKIEFLGIYTQEVLYDGKKHRVVSETKSGTYREWTVSDRLG